LNSKIGKLESKLLYSQSLVGYQFHQWNETIELTKEIHEDFKKVRYPTKAEREAAWQTFSNLRDESVKDISNTCSIKRNYRNSVFILYVILARHGFYRLALILK
jgi:hypothetical protein